MGLGVGWAIALLVALVALVMARGFLIRKRTGRLLPYLLAVLAGILAVLLVTVLVGIFVLR